jgi:hypothetical protein
MSDRPRRELRLVTYTPEHGRDERTMAAWLVRAVLDTPRQLDAGVAAARVGCAPHHVLLIRERSVQL